MVKGRSLNPHGKQQSSKMGNCVKHGIYSTFCRSCDIETIEKYTMKNTEQLSNLQTPVMMTEYFRWQLGVFDDKIVQIDMSQPQHEPAGWFLGYLYYNCQNNWPGLPWESRFGYPHNGGIHSLSFRTTLNGVYEFKNWLESIKPKSHLAMEGKQPFIDILEEKIIDQIHILNQKYVSHQN